MAGNVDAIPCLGYTPLAEPTKQIRLLEFLPYDEELEYRFQQAECTTVNPSWKAMSRIGSVAVEDQAPLQFRMTIHAFQEESSSFVAISYAWGDEAEKVPLLVNGERLYITRNGAAALMHTRRHRLARYYWIDAVCIDQENDTERGHQVRNMHLIYSWAKCVAAFIKDGDIIGPLVQASTGKHRSILTEAGITVKQQRARQKEELVKARDFLLTMTSLSYFERMWIQQEITLAREVWFVDRLRCVSRADFETAMIHVARPARPIIVNSMQRKQLSRSRLLALLGWTFECHYDASVCCGDTESSASEIQDVTLLQFTESTHTSTGTKRRLSDALVLFAGGECKDPRDQIYSLLGLGAPEEEYPVSYHKSYLEVMLDFIDHLNDRDRVVQAMSAINKLLDLLPIDWNSHQARSELSRQLEVRASQRMGLFEKIPETIAIHLVQNRFPVQDAAVAHFTSLNMDLLHLLPANEALQLAEDLHISWQDAVEIPDSTGDIPLIANILRGRDMGRLSLADVSLRLPHGRPPPVFIHPLDLVQILLSKRTSVYEHARANFTGQSLVLGASCRRSSWMGRNANVTAQVGPEMRASENPWGAFVDQIKSIDGKTVDVRALRHFEGTT